MYIYNNRYMDNNIYNIYMDNPWVIIFIQSVNFDYVGL